MELKAEHEKVRQSRFIPLKREREMGILKARSIFRGEAYKLRHAHVKVSKELLHSNADKIQHKIVPLSKTLDNSKRKSTKKHQKRLRENRRKYLKRKRIKSNFREEIRTQTKKKSTKKSKARPILKIQVFISKEKPSSSNHNSTLAKNSNLEGLLPKHYTSAFLQRGRPPDV